MLRPADGIVIVGGAETRSSWGVAPPEPELPLPSPLWSQLTLAPPRAGSCTCGLPGNWSGRHGGAIVGSWRDFSLALPCLCAPQGACAAVPLDNIVAHPFHSSARRFIGLERRGRTLVHQARQALTLLCVQLLAPGSACQNALPAAPQARLLVATPLATGPGLEAPDWRVRLTRASPGPDLHRPTEQLSSCACTAGGLTGARGPGHPAPPNGPHSAGRPPLSSDAGSADGPDIVSPGSIAQLVLLFPTGAPGCQ